MKRKSSVTRKNPSGQFPPPADPHPKRRGSMKKALEKGALSKNYSK